MEESGWRWLQGIAIGAKGFGLEGILVFVI
jgi:hypothetical protein